MINLKKFNTHAEYEVFAESVDYIEPNVSYCEDVKDVHYNKPAGPEPEPLPFELVDLGLPSGTKWASCNLGATKPEEYGDYYMWGSVTPNTNDVCDWAHAPFNNGSSVYNSAYFASVSGDVCPGGVLANEYDAAYVATGGKCHMPTEAQMRELLSATTNTWTIENGVYGKKFTATNGKSIFIPASGFRYSSSFYSQVGDGFVWSSSLSPSNPYYAWYLYFYSSGCLVDYFNYGYRYYGFSVRPVSE